MKPHLSTEPTSGLTLVEVLVIVTAVFMLICLLLPRLAGGGPSKRIGCVNNLKQVGLSFRIWSGDHTNLYPMSLSTEFGGTREHIETGAVFRHFQVLSNELNTPYILVCPADQRRRRATDFAATLSNSNISYFIGVDANEAQPDMLLAGDSNLEVEGQAVRPGTLYLWTNSVVGWTAARHVHQGNVALADGLVQQFNNARLREALARTGAATNRLAIL